ncbi:MAG: tetratricopeptide repeat protein [Spirulina sp.]
MKGRKRKGLRTICQVVPSLALAGSIGVGADWAIATPPRIEIAREDPRTAAEQLYNEAVQLIGQGTAESIRQGIEKLKVARLIWQEMGNIPEEITLLHWIGIGYRQLAEPQQALSHLDRALELSRRGKYTNWEASTLEQIGNIYADLDDYPQALEAYARSLQLFQDLDDRESQANLLLGIATVQFYLGSTREAIASYQNVLELQQNLGDREAEARVLFYLGTAYGSLGENQQSLEALQQALAIHQEQGDDANAAIVLSSLGIIYTGMGETQQALEVYDRALEIYEKLGDRLQIAQTLHGMGWLYRIHSSDYQKALAYFDRALAIARSVGNPTLEAHLLNSKGQTYGILGRSQRSLEAYRQALNLFRNIGDRGMVANLLNQIANVYSDLGEYQEALDNNDRALHLQTEIGDRAGQAATLHYIASIYSRLGDYARSADFDRRALESYRAIGDLGNTALTLEQLGQTYQNLEDYAQSLDSYQQARSIWQQVGNPFGETGVFVSIGRLYARKLNDPQKAIEIFNRALTLSRNQNYTLGEISVLANIARAYNVREEHEKALDFLNQALPLVPSISSLPVEANLLTNFGRTHHLAGNYRQSLNFYQQELALLQKIGDRPGEAEVLYQLARVQRQMGDLQPAQSRIEAALDIIESLRSNVASPDLRTSFFAAKQEYYEFYIDLLMELHQKHPARGYDARAFHASERSRARGLLELLTEANANIRQGVAPQLLQREQNLLQQLNALERRRHELTSSQFTQKDLDDLESQSRSLLQQLHRLEAQIRRTSPRYAHLKYPQPLTLQEIQQRVLDRETLLLEYSLGTERSYLWAVSQNAIASYELPPEAEIAAVAQPFREAITRDSGANRDLGLPLSQILLSPVASQLKNKRLLVVGEGILQYIPFAALPLPTSPDTPLLVQNEIVTLSSASTVAIQREQLAHRSPAPKILAVLADPIFGSNDSRLTRTSSNRHPDNLDTLALTRATRNLGLGESGTSFNRLNYTRTEAEQILALVPDSQQLQALDFQASRAVATHPDLAQYQILHLATHGILDPVNPELSGVVLSLFDETGDPQNGFLRLHDIFNLNLPVELVVLSACETGLGEDIKGEGLVGLTRGFMYAGAKRVVVSLWSVNDAATSEVMIKFYRKMLSEKQNPVQALREAQLEMWNSEQWQSPYYWAAFTVRGDWR